jgi:HK97 family phage major capsid protein
MGATDKILARYAAEAEEHQAVIESLAADAEKNGRDLLPKEMEMIEVRRDRLKALGEQMEPLKETSRIGLESRNRISELHEIIAGQTPERQAEVEYRSAGEYALDYWQAAMGVEAAVKRFTTYNRAAAHQTTADNPGLLPSPIVAPVINFVDQSRPMTTWLGPRQISTQTWSRPKVTQHTNVALQPVGEKNELVSQKMTITSQTVTAKTYGGYVNISKQDLDWSQPSILDLVISDLAGVYGVVTEAALGAAVIAAAPTSDTIPTGAPTVAALNAALWKAAGTIFSATKGQGRLAMFLPPDQLSVWAPLFAPINPTNAISPGFEAANFSSGAMGQISGIPVYMTAGLPAGSSVVVSSSALEVYEDRIGSLQVIEPSVLGLQVAYAGYYTWLVVEPTGLAEIIKTP